MNKAFAGGLLFGTALLASASALQAAEVTYERLQNPEPQNWLMNHHDYGAQRYSSLDAINKSNVKNLKLKFAVALGGSSGNESLEATPLVEDGFMYVADGWGVVYKIDVRSGTAGHIVWKMDPSQEKLDRNRGVALWGNLVISVTSQDARVIATDKETGKMVWEQEFARPAGDRARCRSARAQGPDRGRRLGRRSRIARLDRRARCQDRQPAMEDLLDPGAGRARQRDLEGQEQCLADGGRRVLRHRLV